LNHTFRGEGSRGVPKKEREEDDGTKRVTDSKPHLGPTRYRPPTLKLERSTAFGEEQGILRPDTIADWQEGKGGGEELQKMTDGLGKKKLRKKISSFGKRSWGNTLASFGEKGMEKGLNHVKAKTVIPCFRFRRS